MYVWDASFRVRYAELTLTCLQRLEFYYMINYYFKYIELIDTLFLALKKKPLGKNDVS